MYHEPRLRQEAGELDFAVRPHKVPRTDSSPGLLLQPYPSDPPRTVSSADPDEPASQTDGGAADADAAMEDAAISEPAPAPSQPVIKYLSTYGLALCTPVRLLGSGATGRVDKVTIPRPEGAPGAGGTGPPLLAARKTLPRSRDPHLRAREDAAFVREIDGLLAGQGCPFVVRLLGMATHSDRQELLMELAEGDTLEHELSAALSAVRGEPTAPLLPPARLAAIAASVLSALVALHAQGYAHLDIKPANLLRTAGGRLLLGDAGCMQRVCPADGLLHAPASGTPLYAAPEAKRRGPFSLKADVYSVGVLLAVCTAWHRQSGRVLAWLRGEVALPGYVPEGLRDLLGRLVAADAAVRPSAAEAMSHPFLAGVDVGALAPQRGDDGSFLL